MQNTAILKKEQNAIKINQDLIIKMLNRLAVGCVKALSRPIIASEASFLVCSMARIIYIYNGISGHTSCRKCSKCFYVYLNISPIQYSAMQV